MWWRGLEAEPGQTVTGGGGWGTKDPGSLRSVETQGEERKDVQDEGAGSAEGAEGNRSGLAAKAMRRQQEELAGVGGWVRLQAGGWHGCLHGGGGCGLLCQARLGWCGWSLGVGFKSIIM